MSAEMSHDELLEFLGRRGRVGVLGTLDRRGRPHLVPVWFRFDGNVVTVWTSEERIWVRNLARDSRVAFSVHDDGPPYGGVTMKGVAAVGTGTSAGIVNEIKAISRRYLDEAEVDAYVETWRDLRSIVTIQPERIVSWAESG